MSTRMLIKESTATHTLTGGKPRGVQISSRPKSGTLLPLSNHVRLHEPGGPCEREAEYISEGLVRRPQSGTDGGNAFGQAAEDRRVMGTRSQDIPPLIQKALYAPGRALPGPTHRQMETQFGRDFSDVRIFTDDTAAYAAGLMQARALTVGNNILFGANRFSPESTEGQKLIAHELTHVVQQTPRAPRNSSVPWEQAGTLSRPGKSSRPAACNGSQETPAITQHENCAGIHRYIEADLNADLGGYFQMHGVTGYTRNGNAYSLPPSQSVSEPLDREIIKTMLQSARFFSVFGDDTHDACDSLEKHVTVRSKVVEYAKNAQFNFAVGSAAYYNKKYWGQKKSGEWALLKGVNRAKAVEDMFDPASASKYGLSCKLARQYIMEAGTAGSGVRPETASRDDTIPGEAGYINKNISNPQYGLEGEHIIYLGNGLWWGHADPPQSLTLSDWEKAVNQFDPVSTNARITPDRKCPSVGLL
jgi:hypothetical protein